MQEVVGAEIVEASSKAYLIRLEQKKLAPEAVRNSGLITVLKESYLKFIEFILVLTLKSFSYRWVILG